MTQGTHSTTLRQRTGATPRTSPARSLTRRDALRAGTAVAALPLAAACGGVAIAGDSRAPVTVQSAGAQISAQRAPAWSIAPLNGTDLYYEVAGRGCPLVLTHGVSATAETWAPQVAALADRYRVVTYDARGHGRSGVPADLEAYAEEVFVEDLHQLLRHLGLERACLGGLSMGANITLRFGLAHPDLVDGLIICDAGAGSDDPAAWEQRSLALASTIESRGLEAFAELAIASPLLARYAAQGPQAEQFLRRVLTSHRPEGLARVFRREQATRPPLYAFEPQLRAFTKPVLVVVGEFDQAAQQPCRFLAETLPNAELLVLPGAGHLTNLEAPARFNAAVERFLAQLF